MFHVKREYSKPSKCMRHRGSAAVEHLPHPLKVEGLSPGTAEREKSDEII